MSSWPIRAGPSRGETWGRGAEAPEAEASKARAPRGYLRVRAGMQVNRNLAGRDPVGGVMEPPTQSVVPKEGLSMASDEALAVFPLAAGHIGARKRNYGGKSAN